MKEKLDLCFVLFFVFCFLVFVLCSFRGFHSFSLFFPPPFFFVDAFLPFMFSIFFFPAMTHDAVFLFFADAPNVTKKINHL